jgi:hypothetical protein
MATHTEADIAYALEAFERARDDVAAQHGLPGALL